MFEGEPPTYGERVDAKLALSRSSIDYAREIDVMLGTGSINGAVDFAIKLTRYLLEQNREGAEILVKDSSDQIVPLKINTITSNIERWLNSGN